MIKNAFPSLSGLLFVVLLSSCFILKADTTSRLAGEFFDPPPENKPWVYWFWNNGNLTREGIKADLEAMARTGIGGVLIMEVGQQAPRGPVDFMSDAWRELFRYVIEEAHRHGIEVTMNNDPGWNGSGGPWIRPEDGMQVLTWTETELIGPKTEKVRLKAPEKKLDHYRDIVVWAFPTPADVSQKEAPDPNTNRRKKPENPAVVAKDRMIDLSARMDADGDLTWDVPDGRWTVLRMGHTCKGHMVAPAPAAGIGLECDKLSAKATEAAFVGQIGKLAADNKDFLGKTFVSTHIDSWENGSQNWTPLMREEFRQRRKYDLWNYLPVFAGYVVDGTEFTDRFLWDFRRTVSEMVLDNHVKRMSDLARENGLKLSIEAYGSPCDHLQYGGMADEPIGEFWIGGAAVNTCRGMASAGHLYGRRIIGAEAFTANDSERWLEHPGSIKTLGDRAMCEGINRFIFHRYSIQPWPDVKPGLMMGPWGIHYERTQTWWELTPAWHRYLTRCHYMLRQGDYVADICYLESEESPSGFSEHPKTGFPWDQCGADAVQRMSVRDGKLTLPGGMSYELLVLPSHPNMTPELLAKIVQLVRDGATVLGNRPRAAWGLTDYPNNDRKVAELADALWGDATGSSGRRKVGKGQIVWGESPETVLTEKGVLPDLVSDRELNHIHRRSAEADIYFVANPTESKVLARIDFRASGRPEIWHPETGKTFTAPMYEIKSDRTSLVLPLDATESVFVVFPRNDQTDPADTAVALSFNGTEIVDLGKPFASIVVERALYGDLDDPGATLDVTGLIEKFVADGMTVVPVRKVIEAVKDPKYKTVKTLRIDYLLGKKRYTVAARDFETVYLGKRVPPIRILSTKYGVPGDETKTTDVRELLQRLLNAGENKFPVARLAQPFDPAPMIVKTLTFEYELDGQTRRWEGKDGSTIDVSVLPAESVGVSFGTDAAGPPCLLLHDAGRYELRRASGKTETVNVDAAEPLEIGGPWQVRFPDKNVEFENLMSWSDSADGDIKYFSGTAVYRKTLRIPQTLFSGNRRIYLDLGKVDTLAELSVNGRSLGVLWKLSKTADVTEMLDPDKENVLEIAVTNLWPNRLIGDDFLPHDAERQPNGTLARWPQWLLDGKPDPSGRVTFCMWNLWSKHDALLPSGLLGPVRLVPVERISAVPVSSP